MPRTIILQTSSTARIRWGVWRHAASPLRGTAFMVNRHAGRSIYCLPRRRIRIGPVVCRLLGRLHDALSTHADGRRPRSARGKFMDLNMLVMTGGQERSLTEFTSLFKLSRFRLLSVTPNFDAAQRHRGHAR